ncbi:MAG: hypothetical protein CMI52_04245 [Parcubacteria group bacterium]|nr:hypothetical protein [Parcubacteria group bacterium]|tara:strand:- start:1103 stop:1519 length:417 start_codon:yes stop_codon:yes gene_type:complete
MPVRDWFEEISLTAAARALFRQRGVYDPTDMVCRVPRYWYRLGVALTDLLTIRKLLMLKYAQELQHHSLNADRSGVKYFLTQLRWTRAEILVLNTRDRHDGREVYNSDSASRETDRMFRKSCGRRHKHGESRKHHVKR